jgi:hypothetical protein
MVRVRTDLEWPLLEMVSMMAAAALPLQLSPRAFEELQTNALRIKAAVSALRVWERVFSDEDRRRLGGDLEAAWRRYGTAGMWQQLRGVTAGRAVVEVAHVLGFLDEHSRRWLLRELGEVADDPAQALAMAIASGDLVVVEHPRAAYWRGQQIFVDWDRRSTLWAFFWELCRHAKARQGVDSLTFGQQAHRDIVAKQKARLLAEDGFPVELGKCIKPVGRGTQKLDLPAEIIRIFEMGAPESVREWTA